MSQLYTPSEASTPEGFTQRTGGVVDCYGFPFKALKYVLDEGIYTRAAGMTDPRVMPREEREILIRKLSEIDSGIAGDLEEEQIDKYETTLSRMKAFCDAEFAGEFERAVEGLVNKRL